MKIKINSIRKASLLVTLTVLSILLVGALTGYWYMAVGVLIPVTYLLTTAVIKSYEIFRIKPIYRIVQSNEASSSEIDSLYKGKDLVTEVRSDLQIWAKSNSNEIARLKEMERYRKEFLGNVSHELKTPIFSIQGYVLTLLDGAMEDPAINHRYLLQTEKNIDRLINIVNDLEYISRLETSNLTLDKERFDIIELACEIADSLEIQAQGRRITIRIDNPTDGQILVVADRKRISQVLVNLMTNSIKYGIEDGVTVISFIDMFDRVMVEVKDNGVGMERSVLPRIFERFYRVDKSRSREQGGTGLGLSIVKHILEAHHQTITVRSMPGRGTTFSFTLDTATKGR